MFVSLYQAPWHTATAARPLISLACFASDSNSNTFSCACQCFCQIYLLHLAAQRAWFCSLPRGRPPCPKAGTTSRNEGATRAAGSLSARQVPKGPGLRGRVPEVEACASLKLQRPSSLAPSEAEDEAISSFQSVRAPPIFRAWAARPRASNFGAPKCVFCWSWAEADRAPLSLPCSLASLDRCRKRPCHPRCAPRLLAVDEVALCGEQLGASASHLVQHLRPCSCQAQILFPLSSNRTQRICQWLCKKAPG